MYEPNLAIITNCIRANLHELPDVSSDVVCAISANQQVSIEDVNDGWAYVYTSSGINGYIMEEYVK